MIAISYRREDSMPIAGRLYDRLQAKFGKQNVFMDFDSIPPGVDFRERIRQTIERSNLVIAVIGPHWLGEQSDGSRRIDDPTDFVRLEIEYALKGGIPVIPLLVNSTPMPKPEKLPSDIQPLAFRNALPLDSGLDFHQHTDRLINSIVGVGSELSAQHERESRTRDKARRESTRVSKYKGKHIIWFAILLLLTAGAFAIWAMLGTQRQKASTTSSSTPEVARPGAQSNSQAEPADARIRAAREIGRCDKYRVTTDTSGDQPETTVWVLKQPRDELVATLPAGFLSAGNAIFSADAKYLAFSEGGASAGTRIQLYKIGENGTADEIQLRLTEVAPSELLKKAMQLPRDAGFAHQYQTPTGVFSDPLIVSFDLYVDYYTTEGSKSVDIRKATKFEYRVGEDALVIVGILPDAQQSQKRSNSKSQLNAIDKKFVGVWEGHYDQYQPQRVATMVGRLTVKETGEVIWEILGEPLISPTKEQWMESNLMTICSQPPRPNVAYLGIGSLTLDSDGRSATYISTAGNGVANRGTFHKRLAASEQAHDESVENTSGGFQSQATPTPVASKKVFAGTWEGTVRYFSPPGLNQRPLPVRLLINESETHVTTTDATNGQSNTIGGWIRTGSNRLTCNSSDKPRDTHGLLTFTVDEGRNTATYTEDNPRVDLVVRGSFRRKK